MTRATPEKKAAVLADFRSKKLTRPTDLAKAHGLSRSSVYRILQGAEKDDQTKVEPTKPDQARPEPARTGLRAAIQTRDTDQDDDSDGDRESQMSGNFFFRSTRFADDLGLAETTRREVVETSQERPEEAEAMFEAAIGRITADQRPAADLPMPPSLLLNEIFDDGPVGLSVVRKPPPAPEPVVEFIDRVDLTQRIIFNVDHFGPVLKPIVGPNPQEFIAGLANRSDRELKGLLTTLERTRSVGNIAAGFKQTFYVVAQATEATSRFVGIRSEGFTDRLRQQEEEVTMIMKELAMDHWERVRSMDRPEMRLGMLFCMGLVQTDASNRLRDQVERFKAGKVAPGVVDAHADL